MKIIPRLLCAVPFALMLPGLVLAQSTFTHVHMRVPDPEAAASWYRDLLGGEVRQGGPGPSVRHANGFIGTMPNEGNAGASSGGAIDHFGFGVDDVEAAVERARLMGARIDEEPRAGITAPVIAFIEDPWGARVELMEDSEQPRINHVHLFVDDKNAVRDWFLDIFGGEFVPEQGGENFHCILYEDLWVQISEVAAGERAPSRGRSLDHFGFRISEALPDFAARIEATGYPPYLIRPNAPGSDLLFFEGPGGVHFEIVQRTAQ
ncbi:VOC family protein [Candidatus Rariloculus sp.]|uniref:VOC family protein n=1 Tax=Candidatus Rariloculus sp. TaxID=3101265 RepID=UPI003D12E5B0